MQNYLHTTSHDFKSNFSRYLKTLRAGKYDGILVKHYKKPVGFFALLEPPSEPEHKPEPDLAPIPPAPVSKLDLHTVQSEEDIDMAALMRHLKSLD